MSRQPPPDADPRRAIDDELRFHRDATVETLVAQGWTADDASREADRRFGDAAAWRARLLSLQRSPATMDTVTRTTEAVESWLRRSASAMRRDARYAMRAIRHAPGLAAMTIVTLALGLGGTITMFTAVNAAFLTPLPVADEHRLVKVYKTSQTRSDIRIPLEVARDWHRDSRTTTALAAYLSGITANVSGGDHALRGRVARVTRPFFDVVGVAPARGRIFADDEARLDAAPVVIISHRLWQRALAGRDDVLQQRLLVEGLPIPIIGVMPEGFAYPDDTDIWESVEREADSYASRTAHNFDVIARLEPGVTPATATQELLALTAAQARQFPEMATQNNALVVTPLRDDLLGTQAQLIWIGLAAVGCVLLVACVNVANLMLTRSLSREGEMSLRAALGASRGAIVRVVIVEGLLLALGGAVGGLVLATWGLGAITAITPDSITGGRPLAIDARVGLFTLAIAAVAGIVSALLPSLRAASADPRGALAEGGRTLAKSPRRVMHVLVGVEVALAFVLVFGAAVLVETQARIDRVDSGFRHDGLTLARFSLGLLPGTRYGTAENRRAFFERLETDVASVAGVRGVGLAALMPPGFSPNGRFVTQGVAEATSAHFRLVGGDYFRVMDIAVRRGRVFTPDDGPGRPQVAVINDALAAFAFPGTDPIGQIVAMPGMDGGDGMATIVGIVENVRHRGPTLPPVPEAYFSYRQRPWRTYSMTLIVDSTMDADTTARLVRERGRAIDPTLAPEIGTMAAQMAPFVEPSAFRARLLVIVAGVALLLAIVGIAGVVSHVAARRQREMGIRSALGARPAALAGLVLTTGMRPVVVGMMAGLLAALASARLLTTFVFEISPQSPLALGTATAVILGAGLIASWWPARQSARVDPASALRQ